MPSPIAESWRGHTFLGTKESKKKEDALYLVRTMHHLMLLLAHWVGWNRAMSRTFLTGLPEVQIWSPEPKPPGVLSKILSDPRVKYDKFLY